MQVTHELEPESWSLRWRDVMLRLRLHGGALLADYFGPANEHEPPSFPGPEVFDALTVSRADTSVQLAPDNRQVAWSCSGWTQPDSATLAMTLHATNCPLRAELRFTADEKTGILHR